MLQAVASDRDVTLPLLEGGVTAIVFAGAFLVPRLGSGWFPKIERVFLPLARRKAWAVVCVALAALLLRLAILPFCPVPLPFLPDDFSFLLSADTFAQGRLTNPTPAMWTHFETIHVSMQPTYMSMYFPGQGLLFAASKLLLGHPWYGNLITSALMCAAICWMLQAWLPSSWAFLGGMLAVLRLGLFSYWINTYTGAGLTTALGGALILGALPRLMRTAQARYGVLLSVGIAILILTRPYEGMLLCLPVAAVLGRWVFFGKNRPAPAVMIRRAALPLVVIVGAAAWMGYYDYRAFGSPLTLPYTVNRATYAMAPYFIWQSPRPEPAYRHAVMRSFYYTGELDYLAKAQKLGFPRHLLTKAWTGLTFFSGAAYLIPLIMLRRVLLDRRIRFLVLCVLILTAGMAVQIYMIPHYLAPFTAAFYAIGLQAMRHLRVWKPEGKPAGILLVRMTVVITLGMAGMRLCAEPLHLAPSEWPAYRWSFNWFGPGYFGTERVRMETELNHLPGKHLVIVHYTSKHNPFEEWVYNAADMDNSKVIWAREMHGADNRELVHYYRDRDVWLAEPDEVPARLSPYPVPENLATALSPTGRAIRAGKQNLQESNP